MENHHVQQSTVYTDFNINLTIISLMTRAGAVQYLTRLRFATS